MTRDNGRSDFKPHGWHTITPCMVVPNARELVQFIKDVFSATADPQPDAPTILRVGDSRVLISDAASPPAMLGGRR